MQKAMEPFVLERTVTAGGLFMQNGKEGFNLVERKIRIKNRSASGHLMKPFVRMLRFFTQHSLWTLPLSITLALSGWFALTNWFHVPTYLLPAPDLVWARFLMAVRDGSLFYHLGVTFNEVVLGLSFGLLLATSLGYLLAKSPAIERLLSPYIVASQSIPTVALAPLLVIWFGPGRISKIFISALLVFFPVLVNTIVGMRSVSEDLRDLMRSLQASKWQIFTRLEIPAAMPVFLGGLKVGATLSVIGAVVGEFVASDEGLGFMINVARGLYDTSMVFVAVFVLIALAITLYGVVAILELIVLRWKNE